MKILLRSLAAVLALNAPAANFASIPANDVRPGFPQQSRVAGLDAGGTTMPSAAPGAARPFGSRLS